MGALGSTNSTTSIATTADLDAHVNDTTDAHDASAISFTPNGSIAATDVQAAIQEVRDEASGSGIPATIVDVKGDLIVATAADTVGRLAAGANGTRPEAASGETTGIKWSLPPGHEFDYVPKTTDTSITATTEGTANTIVTGNAVAYDGSTVVLIEFFAANGRPDNTAASRTLLFWLYDGASSIGAIAAQVTPAAASAAQPVNGRARITPSAATHTYSVRASVNAGTGLVSAGAGGAGVYYPAFIRITKV